MSDGARGRGPTARPPHPATVVQRKEPHPATVVQRKEPHPATVVQRKEPHAATVVRPQPSAAASWGRALPDERTSIQRMNLPSTGARTPEQWLRACVGLLAIELSDGRSAIGTGTLITRQHVLTCAHNCMEARNGFLTGVRATKVTFYPGYVPQQQLAALDQIPPNQPAFKVDLCVYFDKYAEVPRSGDIAVFRLTEECFPAKRTQDEVPVFPRVAPKGELLKYTRGHGRPEPRLYGYRFDGKITVDEFSQRTNLLVYRANTEPGSSGSPIFMNGVIWGVHSCVGSYTFGLGIFDNIRAFIFLAVRLERGDEDPFVVSCGTGD